MEDERALLARVADHDREAFTKLFQLYAGRIYRYALVMLGDREAAEEVAQETMRAVWNGARSFRGRSRPSSWILGIACNKALDGLRQRRRAGLGEPGPDSPSPNSRHEGVRSTMTRWPHVRRRDPRELLQE